MELKEFFTEYISEKGVKGLGSLCIVRNLDDSVTDDMLKQLFHEQGEVNKVDKIREGKVRIIEMSNPSEAKKAQKALDGYNFEGCTLEVSRVRTDQKRGFVAYDSVSERIVRDTGLGGRMGKGEQVAFQKY
jgi:hypothetical protein